VALLHEARAHERAGAIVEAIQCYEDAVRTSEATGEHAVLAEALRRRGVVHHLRHEPVPARDLCNLSREIATRYGHTVLAAEAINALAGFDFESGAIESAREGFYEALALGGSSAELRGRIEQNLGILANMQGALAEAMAHYQQSLFACEAVGDDRGRAIAYHNLGMVSADRELWEDADRYYQQCLTVAQAIGDIHLQGLGLLNHSEVHLARQRYDLARQNAEAALAIFDRLGSKLDKADAFKVIGRTYRETGRHALAEAMEKFPPGSDTNAYFRMVTSYWEMAASFVVRGVLHEELFFENNGEMLLVWERIRGIVEEYRKTRNNPMFYRNLEKAAGKYIQWMNANAPGAYETFQNMVNPKK